LFSFYSFLLHRQQLLLKDEIIALKQENNALKGSLAQLRKSNVQVHNHIHVL